VTDADGRDLGRVFDEVPKLYNRHERFAPGNPDWGDPPLEEEVWATSGGWGPDLDTGDRFGLTSMRWYPMVQHFDGDGFADLLRSHSPSRRLDPGIREPLLQAVAERIRTDMGDHVVRRYLAVMRVGSRVD
jgi:hypothetical protein